MVGQEYTALPTDLPAIVSTLATQVTRDAPTRFEKAVALQQWFSSTGGFTYSTRAAPGNGVNDLVRFLSDNEGGRTGYCEQFASAMAVMARVLHIPARVAVGFLEPDQVGPNTYEYSTHDLHAWPELFFPGSGWVRFEPTPAGAGTSVPSYTTQQLPVVNPTSRPSASASSSILPSHRPNDTANPSESAAAATHSDGGPGFPWLPVGGGLLVVVLAAGLALVPARCVVRVVSAGWPAARRRRGPSCVPPRWTSGCPGPRGGHHRRPAAVSRASSALPWTATRPSVPPTDPRWPRRPWPHSTGSCGRSSCRATHATRDRTRR
ncbi:transglutaminase-like domain-containing protein [Nocardioides ungokensis]|uniref:transglutaminase-like domain-containing protein n=1 Tax=Nocardioides ungokensis TaxID=1643322 RepID=UPI0015DF2781|nr:transglutaminase-like domain-containing protein [Nocardioides ungokensis]